jgi:hypothetical protein
MFIDVHNNTSARILSGGWFPTLADLADYFYGASATPMMSPVLDDG